MITDQPERLIISDIVREKILLSTRDEIPHAIAVDVDEMKTVMMAQPISALLSTVNETPKGHHHR